MLAEYRRLLRSAFQEGGGYEIDTAGDGFFVAFHRATHAVAAAVAAQRAIAAHPWPEGTPVRVRLGLHTGEPTLTTGGYVGLDVHRAARMCAAGHGGQILLSQTTCTLVEQDLPSGVGLRGLGEHRLKDLQRPERLFQLVIADLPADFSPLKSLDALPNNLPTQLTSFIGREREIAEVKRLLSTARLLTLTGPGGTGKTRLGLQVAADLLEDFEGGVFFVPLAPISDPGLVVSTIAQTLRVRETGGQPLLKSLQEYLQDKSMLLLLDNFEQVISAAPVVAELLVACPKLKVLVTSREALHLSGEQESPVSPLVLPDLKRLPAVEALSQYAAVELFIQRALAVKPDFAVTNENAPAVAEICVHLDGLPLAIELAAARIKLFPPKAMLARLVGATGQSPLQLLTGGARDLPARHQTLRGAIAWSYDLLDVGEKTLFRRLSVFSGGCTPEAAEKACNTAGDLGMDLLDALASLVGKSLLRQEEQADGKPRFVMLETIQEYGLECLAASGEADAIRCQHADYYLALAEEADPKLTGAEQGVWFDRFEAEHDNLRAALEWLAQSGGAEKGLRLGGAMWQFWEVRGYLAEGRERLARLLALPGASVRTKARMKVLYAAGVLADAQGDYAAARALFEESLAINRELGDRRGIAVSLNNLGIVTLRQQDYTAARFLYEESLAIWRELGNRRAIALSLNNLGNVANMQGNYAAARSLHEESLAIFKGLGDRHGIAWSVNHLGDVARDQGDYATARSLYGESLAIFRELGDKWGIASSLTDLGHVAGDQGDYAAARSLYKESLAIARQLGDKRGIARVLEGFVGLAAAQAEPERALRLAAAATALRGTIGAPLPPAEQARLERRLGPARQTLSEEARTEAWAEGRALTLEQTIAYALTVEVA